jgi:hypothetical protein
MTETFKICLEKLEALTTQELDRSVAELVLVENRNVALVIADRAGQQTDSSPTELQPGQ